MKGTVGALLVRRVLWWAEGLAKRAWNPAVDLSEKGIAEKYRGIDGRPWPQEISPILLRDNGLASTSQWPILATLAKEHSNDRVYDAVVLCKSPLTAARNLYLEFLGFDFGFYDDEYSVYSSIYHEIIYGSVADLRRYATRLNESLLLPTAIDVDEYRKTRESLRTIGHDIEQEPCYEIAIFGQSRASS